MVWFRYIDDIFFVWAHGIEKPEEFMADFNAFNPNIEFTYDSSKKYCLFRDLDVALYSGRLESTVHVKHTDRHQYLHYSSSHLEHTKRSMYLVKLYMSVEFVLEKRIFKTIASK